jgi:hypothetical protein
VLQQQQQHQQQHQQQQQQQSNVPRSSSFKRNPVFQRKGAKKFGFIKDTI